MRHFGFAFRGRDEDDNIIVDKTFTGEVLKYKLLNIFEFNSDRKRMSVIVRTPDNRIMIVCKGADSIINARLEPGQASAQETNRHLESYAEVGLRTLLISYKYIDETIYLNWLEGFKVASSDTQNRDKLIGKC
jgi:magnesium-transporting ATPase (P-type)